MGNIFIDNGGDSGNGCLGCLALIGILFIILLFTGSIKCNSSRAATRGFTEAPMIAPIDQPNVPK
ncbi:MAG TPA: hypothetical protein VFK30_00610 [Anaerolineae bacterium]|nr:hypothetical protein [Anaerolineae bacterium]